MTVFFINKAPTKLAYTSIMPWKRDRDRDWEQGAKELEPNNMF